MHRFLNHSILASLERILHEISNEKSNTENGDLEDYQKNFSKLIAQMEVITQERETQYQMVCGVVRI